MKNLKQLEQVIKRKDRTQNDIVKYLLASKEEMREESKRFSQTNEFQIVIKKLRELKKE